MDLWCQTCGEPWDLDHVLHEVPEDFEMKNGIAKCPACPKDGKISKGMRERAEMARMLGQVLGDDLDGIAAELADLEEI